MSNEHEVTLDVSELGISEYGLSLFASGHPRDAIRHETQDLLNQLQRRTGRHELDGQDLVQAALADKDPIVAFNELRSRRDRDEHAAVRLLLLGMVRGFRNVYSHNVSIDVSTQDGVVWLGVLGQLRRQIERAEQVGGSAGDRLSG